MMRNEEKLSLEAESRGLPVDLGDGLLMRWAVPDDAEELGEFIFKIHTDNPDEPEAWLKDWTRDLMSGRHPTTAASDFTLVVDRQAGDKIVSCLNLISQTWAYDGIPFAVGRIELVGTDPDYRRRGLVRRQMTAVHGKSAARDELVQSITGIPWYYRLFGYEMALNLGGGRLFFWDRPGNNKAVTEEIYRLRPAVETDIPVLEELYVEHSADSLVVHQRSREIWTYELFTAQRETPAGQNISMVEDSTGQVVAYVEIDPHGSSLAVREMGVGRGYSWRAIALFLVRELKRHADKINQEREKKPITSINFRLGESHPVYDALGSQLEKGQKPYAWYIRVPDLAGFLRHITPALERRLAESVMAGHSGTLRLNFYRSNLTLLFEKGKLREIGTYEPNHIEDADVLFPDLTFLQLLFGYRSYEELDFAFADCYTVNAEAAVLLNCLFPRRPSDINPLS
jgi:ribosomal protein S18 acetylase RimI-like enzyme